MVQMKRLLLESLLLYIHFNLCQGKETKMTCVAILVASATSPLLQHVYMFCFCMKYYCQDFLFLQTNIKPKHKLLGPAKELVTESDK